MRWAPTISYLLVTAAATLGLLLLQERNVNRLEDLQFASCVRGDALRDENNARTYVIDAFLREAATARRRGSPADWATAVRYDALRHRLHNVPPVNCEEAIRR